MRVQCVGRMRCAATAFLVIGYKGLAARLRGSRVELWIGWEGGGCCRGWVEETDVFRIAAGLGLMRPRRDAVVVFCSAD